ncbi:MAG: PDZ domain-containing protein [Bacteroidota bacterium]
MNYRLSFDRPKEHIVSISIKLIAPQDSLTFALPFWRPGRYAAQSFARNIGEINAQDQQGNALPIERISSLKWTIAAKKGQTVLLQYDYYTHQLDAGGSYYDEKGIYINGINLFLSLEGHLAQACQLELDIPEEYEIAGAMHGKGPIYTFEDYHQLVDSPFFAAPDLTLRKFNVGALPVYLWFMGEGTPDLDRMERDIRAYSEAQIAFFGQCPVDEYHYLNLLLPYRYRHGVEHYNSTVIVMGPGYQLMERDMYRSFLEISSHEFFHTWNVKALRPADLFPYRYDSEVYSRLHYVTEGVTTYYGDLMLWKSGVYGPQQWIDSINGELRSFYTMGGREAISLGKASLESWINGYDDTGMPNRRISFYTKGYLVAMLLDFTLRRGTQDRVSLDLVMRQLYQKVTSEKRGYTREDFQTLIEKLSGESYEAFFADYIEGTRSLETLLGELAKYYGLQMRSVPLGNLAQSAWGLKAKATERGVLIEKILPHSPLIEAGLHPGDTIISLNRTQIQDDFENLLAYEWQKGSIEIHYFKQNALRSAQLNCPTEFAYTVPQFWLIANQEDPQHTRFQAWRSISTQSIH